MVDQGVFKGGLACRDEEGAADGLVEEHDGRHGGEVLEGDRGLGDDDGDLEPHA